MRVFALGLLVASAAFAQKIQIEFDQAMDFEGFRTFAILSGRLNSKNPALNSELVRKQINLDIERDLSAKGLTLAPAGSSDLNIRYTMGTVRKSQLETYPAGWRGWGTAVVRVPYTEGTLVIDLHDARTHALVWRAIASQEKSDPSKIQGKLDDMVRKSLDKYPPKMK